MSPKEPEGNVMEVKCPRCKRKVAVSVEEADKRGKVRCPCGQEIELVKMIGGGQ